MTVLSNAEWSSRVGGGAWVAIATLLRPQGRRGELLAEPLSDLADIFAAGREVALAATGTSPGESHDIRTIEAHWLPSGKNAGRVVLKLSGCESINDAEALAGRQVFVAATALPKLDDDTFFVGDLLGCTLFDNGFPAGMVVDIEFPAAPDGRTRLEDAAPLLAVQQGDAEPVLVPFVRAWLDEVDIAGRRIAMRLPAGLLDEQPEASDVDQAT